MADLLEVGDRLHAKSSDGEFYKAEVVDISKSSRRARKPVKVHFVGYSEGDDEWVAISDLKSKKLPKAAGAAKAKAKAKADAVAKPDLSGLPKGTILRAQGDDGNWYKAEVIAVNARRKQPIKVNWCGYTADSDEWLAVDKLRSKALRAGGKAKGKSKAEAKERRPAKPRPAMQQVPILKKLKKFAAEGLEKAAIESGPSSAPSTLSFKALLANVEENSKVIAELLAGAPADLPRHVAFLVNPSLAYVVTEFSVWAAGAACVPLSVHSPGPELEYFVENSEARLLIADEAMASKLAPVAEKFNRSFAKISSVSGEGPPKFQIAAQGSAQKADAGDTAVLLSNNALILYTSGTTGKPKGVVHTFRSLSEQYMSLSKAWKWTSKDHTLHVLPLHHVHGVQNILNTALYNGAAVEFCAFDAGYCLKRLCSGDITCFHAVPTIYVKFTQHMEKLDESGREEIKKGLRNDSMRYMVSGSAALPVPTMKSWAEISGHVLLERYGMTEIGMALSNKIDGTRYPGCVGWPLPRVRVKVEDGAILIKGPLVFKEYYRNEEATKKEFTEDGWFKTGDAVQVGGTDEERQLMQQDARDVEAATGRPRPETAEAAPKSLETIHKIMGRSSVDIIKSGGYKISALEIESVLLQHDKIKECAVIGKPDETWGEKVTAVCVLTGGELPIKDLRDWGKERMATYKVPQELIAVSELPRNQMGKLEKKKIIEQYSK